MGNIEISFPEELIYTLKMDKDEFRDRVLLYVLGKLYEEGYISAGFAAKLLGVDRWKFYELLSKHGFYVIDYFEEELEEEA